MYLIIWNIMRAVVVLWLLVAPHQPSVSFHVVPNWMDSLI